MNVEGRNDYLPRIKEGMITYLVLNECKGRIVKEGMNNE